MVNNILIGKILITYLMLVVILTIGFQERAKEEEKKEEKVELIEKATTKSESSFKKFKNSIN